jgi:Secretion system C-terminal sorting domain
MKLGCVLYAFIYSSIHISANAQDLNWNSVAYTTGSLNSNFGSIGNPGVSVSLNFTGYTAGLAAGSPAKRIATPQAGTGTVCTQFCALRSAPTFSNPTTQSLVLTFTFSPAISPLSFPIYDIDGTGSVIDSIRITASGPSGAQVITAANVNPATSFIYGSGSTSVVVKGGTGNLTDPQTNVFVSGYVNTLVLTFMGQGSFSVGNMSWAIALPVKWISFTGNKTNTGVVDLKWITENEDQCDYYIIERSKDGLQFQEIARTSPKRESRNSYSFTDNNPNPGNNYYRIVEIDMDGRKGYSKIIAITQSSKDEHTFTVTPNPSSDYILLNSTENARLKKIEIYNSVGKKMYQSQQENSRINIDFLSSGMYFLKSESTEGKTFSAKFLKR